ncbi:ABC transporter permease subunit [Aggregatilinea lenta]|uniref:ABC transporter permease subunit n=1 Tax=Aggregatilinea lenta TaxID=913108 RepID=UPI000E5B251D|nr:ABC transporter permease subunit [Aggregatilinea lenta]
MQQTDSVPPNLDLAHPDIVVVSRPSKSLWRETLERLLRKPSAIVGLSILSFLIVVAVFAPLIATHDPLAVLLDTPEEGVVKRMSPCIHLLGCPTAGDELVRVSMDAPIDVSALSATSALMLTASGTTVDIWNADSGKPVANFELENPVTAVSWSPNDQKILAATTNGDIVVWDMNTRSLNRTLEHEGGATYIAWNADGTRFLSADDHTVRLWDALSWNQVAAIDLDGERIASAWNTNGTLVMTASGSTVKLWNAFTGTEVTTLEHDAPLTSAVFNKASTSILSTSSNTLHIWNANSYTEDRVIEYDGDLSYGAWSEDLSRGVIRVMATSGDTVVVWNARTGDLLLELPHGEPVVSVASSPLATRIMTQGEHQIRVWDATNGENILTFDRDEPVTKAAWESTGGAVLVTAGDQLSAVKTSDKQYLMGIDGNVRDQFSRVVYGARLSLMVGITTVTFAVIIGVFTGAVAGYLGGWPDNIIMRVMDVVLAFPSLILAIAVVTVLGPGLINALLAISIVSIPAYARVARSGVLAVKEEDYVMADRVLGVAPVRILFRRILPNALAPLIVQATLGIGTAILDAAALSFLGLGAQPPTPEWGAMLGAERNQIFTAPHLVFYPGIAIMITVLAFNLLGDGLRDALDPRLDR